MVYSGTGQAKEINTIREPENKKGKFDPFYIEKWKNQGSISIFNSHTHALFSMCYKDIIDMFFFSHIPFLKKCVSISKGFNEGKGKTT
jgi:hypothetical protein